MPHSMSGIEALYWAREYSDEVSGIIGLDMSVPESYYVHDIEYERIADETEIFIRDLN